MQNIKFAKTTIAAVVVVTALATLQMMSAQSAAAQPTFNQGQCVKQFQDPSESKKETREACKEAKPAYNPGQCRKEGLPELPEDHCETLPVKP
jgi:hypothetical protein